MNKHRFLSFSFAVTITLLGTLALTLIFSSWLFREQQRLLDSYLNLADKVFTSVAGSLEQLNQLPSEQCDEALLLHMRRAVFLNPFIQDIGLIDNDHLSCTTASGPIEPPLPIQAPSYRTDQQISVWIDEELYIFDFAYRAHIMQLGRFNAVVDGNQLNPADITSHRWQIVGRSSNGLIPIFGEPELFNMTQPGTLLHRSAQSHLSQRCAIHSRFCMGIETDHLSILKTRPELVLMSLMVLLLMLLLSYNSAFYWLQHRATIASRVRRGLSRHCFYPVIQVIVDINTDKVIGGEILARFNDAQGSLTPDQFIPELQRQGLSWRFTQHIVTESLQRMIGPGEQLKHLKLSFNVFPSDVESNKIVELLDWPEVQAFPGSITLEITEDLHLDAPQARQNIQHLIDHGLEIAIDDFGTGYSNLQQLKRFSCHYLKIDRSFTYELEEGAIRSSLIPMIIDIAHSSELKVVAEGVENIMQARALRELGVEYAQGWMYGKPTSIEQFLDGLGD
ncbi:EAL domain-containing protein [Aliagarivorans marinus]|uniref:EAL domain-containing protein n=1 Tax=Aliagarivorans marinus TaxID=561965 RepID=UPI0004220A21|nr:EAL domain-containing protein [Aliagarivorans marinus]